ncbi:MULTISPECIES: hypothetical protein [unclassified Streptomyces]|uniref:hypothetical protein n=1 Tax=unclassified Streptomyces TaxID=2593676 RepID=UPI00274120A1|nr:MULTISPECIES: hypothetical protein [unclassified Streptomyces]
MSGRPVVAGVGTAVSAPSTVGGAYGAGPLPAARRPVHVTGTEPVGTPAPGAGTTRRPQEAPQTEASQT